MIERIGSLADVRPGDICIMRMGGFIPGFLPVHVGQMMCRESFTIGPYSADHVVICVESAGPGRPARDVPFGELIKGQDDGTYRSLPRGVQAMPAGAEEIALTPAKHWTDGVAWFRIPEDYPGQAQDAATIARLFVSERVPYSFLSYLALAAWSRGLKAARLEKWIDRRGWQHVVQMTDGQGRRTPMSTRMINLPAEAICSVLADQAWSLAGKRVMEGVARQCVTPGAMAIQLSRRLKPFGPGFL